MKKSEMLKILEERFSNYENARNIAERALSYVENAGMLPPYTYESNFGGCSGCSQCYGDEDCTREHVSECYWEPENEKKS